MLEPEPFVLDARQCLLDAQAAFAGAVSPLGFYTASWYGTNTSDERGLFGIVDPAMGLSDQVGEIVEVSFYPQLALSARRSVRVYIIGSEQELGTDIGITRRAYMTLQFLAIEPITVSVGVVL